MINTFLYKQLNFSFFFFFWVAREWAVSNIWHLAWIPNLEFKNAIKKFIFLFPNLKLSFLLLSNFQFFFHFCGFFFCLLLSASSFFCPFLQLSFLWFFFFFFPFVLNTVVFFFNSRNKHKRIHSRKKKRDSHIKVY